MLSSGAVLGGEHYLYLATDDDKYDHILDVDASNRLGISILPKGSHESYKTLSKHTFRKNKALSHRVTFWMNSLSSTDREQFRKTPLIRKKSDCESKQIYLRLPIISGGSGVSYCAFSPFPAGTHLPGGMHIGQALSLQEVINMTEEIGWDIYKDGRLLKSRRNRKKSRPKPTPSAQAIVAHNIVTQTTTVPLPQGTPGAGSYAAGPGGTVVPARGQASIDPLPINQGIPMDLQPLHIHQAGSQWEIDDIIRLNNALLAPDINVNPHPPAAGDLGISDQMQYEHSQALLFEELMGDDSSMMLLNPYMTSDLLFDLGGLFD